ncbi:uncharacterized protein LOC131956564 [Physella acuta]|uniref:uncharacterized protein LOC131956564 n=1 Tax=Physella acuta TaxID=109671 RepID=UPI0027DB13C1|nr:uncharacterized protein LOC131956564 [Physella acuta]
MEKGEFIFGVRPECLFINTQLGNRNPFLRDVTKPNENPGIPKHLQSLYDFKDFAKYPDAYWKLRESLEPDVMEASMIDRDLYRKQQISSLKLTTMDRTPPSSRDPFIKWRGKAGDPLFYPRKQTAHHVRRAKTSSPHRAGGSSKTNTQADATSQLEINAKSYHNANNKHNTIVLESVSALAKDTETDSVFTQPHYPSPGRSEVLETMPALSQTWTSRQNLKSYDVQATSTTSLASNLLSKTNSDTRKFPIKPSVISVELDPPDSFNRPRLFTQRSRAPSNAFSTTRAEEASTTHTTPARRIKTASTYTTEPDIEAHSDPETVTLNHSTADFELANGVTPSPENIEEASLVIDTHAQVSTTKNQTSDSTVHDTAGTSPSALGFRPRQSPVPLKTLHLEMFKPTDTGKATPQQQTVSQEAGGYKLDIVNSPAPNDPEDVDSRRPPLPENEEHVCILNKNAFAYRKNYVKSGKKHRKNSRPSKSANSVCLKISACF